MTAKKFQDAITDLSEVSAAMGHLKELYWHRDSSSDETGMIAILSDRLRTTTEKFYNLEDEVVRGVSRTQSIPEKIEMTR